MPEPAAPVAAPASPVAAPKPPTPKPPPSAQGPSDDLFNSADSFHEYSKLAQERYDANSRAEAKPPPAPVVSRETMTPPPEGEPLETAPEVDANAPAPEVDPNAVAPDVAAQQAADLEQWSAFKSWMQTGGELPDELADVPIQLPNGGIETMAEIVKGFMRQDDHTNGWREMQAREQRADAAVNAYKQHFDQIEDPDPIKGGDAMYEVYTRGSRRKAFYQAALKLAADERQDNLLAQGAALAFAREEGLVDAKGEPLWQHRRVDRALQEALKEREQVRTDRDMGRQRDWENQRLRQQNEARTNDEAVAANSAKITKQLDQLRPRAFTALGLLHDAETIQIFDRKLQARVQQTNAKVLSGELVMEAAKMTRDHIAHMGKPAAKPAAKLKPFTPSLGGGGSPPNGKAPEDDLSLDENFARKFGIRSWQS